MFSVQTFMTSPQAPWDRPAVEISDEEPYEEDLVDSGQPPAEEGPPSSAQPSRSVACSAARPNPVQYCDHLKDQALERFTVTDSGTAMW